MTATKAGDTWTVPSLVTDDVILLVAGHTLSILRKQDCKWLLARDANMLAPQK
ncbi:MAG: hypothetical protein ACRET4_02910 [Steroidobacteraceae bacterium]